MKILASEPVVLLHYRPPFLWSSTITERKRTLSNHLQDFVASASWYRMLTGSHV